jgi:carboxylesterase
VNPACHTRLYTHDRRTERSLVLLHGFTNCPAQLDAIGRDFFDRGWNVLIPRYPRHGYTDRLNTSLAELRSDHLIALTNRACDAGAGLGDRVTVAGLSLGAILAGYAAQTRADVERAVLVAPMLGLRPIPGPALTAMSEVALVVPNFFIWWNAKARDAIGPPHGYPRFATRAYTAMHRTGRTLLALASRSAPLAGSIVVITNAAEPRLDNRHTYRLIDRWRKHGAPVETFEFAKHERLPHDLLDPAGNPPEVTARSYPVVRRFITGESWSVTGDKQIQHPVERAKSDHAPRRKARRAKEAARE